ncbi:hypothetical protein DBP15_05260 [Streptomyces sp. CS065A]|nr:hypothetical protein DBP15_05260 [Streptomyces sp. CS065A]
MRRPNAGRSTGIEIALTALMDFELCSRSLAIDWSRLVDAAVRAGSVPRDRRHRARAACGPAGGALGTERGDDGSPEDALADEHHPLPDTQRRRWRSSTATPDGRPGRPLQGNRLVDKDRKGPEDVVYDWAAEHGIKRWPGGRRGRAPVPPAPHASAGRGIAAR